MTGVGIVGEDNGRIRQLIEGFSSRLDGFEQRLAILLANWERTLRTWVRMERRSLEQEQAINTLKKNRIWHS
jgi:hypothetical protein